MGCIFVFRGHFYNTYVDMFVQHSLLMLLSDDNPPPRKLCAEEEAARPLGVAFQFFQTDSGRQELLLVHVAPKYAFHLQTEDILAGPHRFKGMFGGLILVLSLRLKLGLG